MIYQADSVVDSATCFEKKTCWLWFYGWHPNEIGNDAQTLLVAKVVIKPQVSQAQAKLELLRQIIFSFQLG